jgi:phytoene dehydrogenase-like protein
MGMLDQDFDAIVIGAGHSGMARQLSGQERLERGGARTALGRRRFCTEEVTGRLLAQPALELPLAGRDLPRLRRSGAADGGVNTCGPTCRWCVFSDDTLTARRPAQDRELRAFSKDADTWMRLFEEVPATWTCWCAR